MADGLDAVAAALRAADYDAAMAALTALRGLNAKVAAMTQRGGHQRGDRPGGAGPVASPRPVR